MMEKKYYYPDINDEITISFIKENEPYQGYWEKSEKRILDQVRERIEKHKLSSRNSWLLDAGCGTGRLLPEFQKYFSNILASDPDSSQIEKAKKVAMDHGFADKILFRETSADQLQWEKDGFDVILCSHVIQHVHTDVVPRIIKKFYEILRSDGLLFVMTTHSRKSTDYYVKGVREDKRSIEVPVEKEEFNSLIRNDQNILPLHFFSIKNLVNLFEQAGFSILDFQSFHILKNSPLFKKTEDRDNLVNASDRLKKGYGRDVYFASQKQRK